MILYHGTLMSSANNILKKGILPKINIENELDFGYGFYLGDLKYAQRIAKDKAKNDKSSFPVTMEYEVHYKDILTAYDNALIFQKKTDEYLTTVFECRYNKGKEYLNVSLIDAPIADGLVNIVMSWYKRKESATRKRIVRFMYWLPSKHRQLVIKNKDACKYLVLKRILNMKGEILWEES